jgi:hypothetical protein
VAGHSGSWHSSFDHIPKELVAGYVGGTGTLTGLGHHAEPVLVAQLLEAGVARDAVGVCAVEALRLWCLTLNASWLAWRKVSHGGAGDKTIRDGSQEIRDGWQEGVVPGWTC